METEVFLEGMSPGGVDNLFQKLQTRELMGKMVFHFFGSTHGMKVTFTKEFQSLFR